MTPGGTIACCIAFRVALSFCVITTFAPDEYWQSLEVAYRSVFGKGLLTWEWDAGLRTYLHPLIYHAMYQVFAWAGLDTAFALINAPKVFHAILTGLVDYLTSRAAVHWFRSPDAGSWTLLLSLTSWFHFYNGPRSYSNNIETICTIAAISCYPKAGPIRRRHTRGLLWFLFFAGLGTAFRVTNAIIWVPCGLDLVWRAATPLGSDREGGNRVRWGSAFAVAAFGVAFVGAGQALVLGVDTWYYGRLVSSTEVFLQFNVLEGKAAVFGTHPIHWYLSQGMPVVCGPAYFLAALGAVWGTKDAPAIRLYLLIAWVLLVYSLLPHKEFRFIYPVLPLTLMAAGRYLAWLSGRGPGNVLRPFWRAGGPRYEKCARWIVWVSVAFCIGMCTFFGAFHQAATISVMGHLRGLPPGRTGPAGNREVHFLIGCHQTPGHPYLHGSGMDPFWLDCSPKFDKAGERLPSQDTLFHKDPEGWFVSVYGASPQGKGASEASLDPTPEGTRTLPYRFVIFDHLEPTLGSHLSKQGYKLEAKLPHTPIPEKEDNISSHLCVYAPDHD